MYIESEPRYEDNKLTTTLNNGDDLSRSSKQISHLQVVGTMVMVGGGTGFTVLVQN